MGLWPLRSKREVKAVELNGWILSYRLWWAELFLHFDGRP